jgi:hypothetical protein
LFYPLAIADYTVLAIEVRVTGGEAKIKKGRSK